MSYVPQPSQPSQPDDSFSVVPPEDAMSVIADELASVQQEISDLLISLEHPDLPAKTVTALHGQLEAARTILDDARRQARRAVVILKAAAAEERSH